MSFATDYTTAYNLLRQGRVDKDILDKVLNSDLSWSELDKRVDVMGRVSAAIYAFKMTKEMRRQKVLVNFLMDIKEDKETRKVGNKNITLFPITVNKTVVQMRESDKS